MGRRVVGNSDIQSRKHMRGVPQPEQAGTSSSAIRLRRSSTRAQFKPPPPPPDSLRGSWTTVSPPKQFLQQTAGTGSSQARSFPPPPTSPSSSRQQDTSKPSVKRHKTTEEAPRQAHLSPSRFSLGPRRRSSPSPAPPAIRSLVPEPAPPPVGSADRISSKQISNSSRDRPPPLNRGRRISTPYPHPNAARTSSKQPASRPRKRMPKKGDAPYITPPKWTTDPHAAAQYLQSLGLNMPAVQPIVPRRASPVPPSSSKSDSSRSSSESYVSLNDDQPGETTQSTQRSQPSDYPSDFIALAPHMSSSKTPSSLPISPPLPVAGVPQIFSRHLIPLPTLTFPSLRGLRPTALPTTTNEVASTVEDPNGTEYASDHPHDLQMNSLLMPDELDRVRQWTVHVELSVRQTIEEGSTPTVEEDEIVPEAWDWERPAKIDFETLMPGKDQPSPLTALLPDSPLVARSMKPANESPRTQPFPPSIFRAFPVSQSMFERTVPQTAYSFTTIPSPGPLKQTVPVDVEENQVNLDSEQEEGGQQKPALIISSSVDGETTGQGGMTSLVSPSPFSPLPSPFRYAGKALSPAPRAPRPPLVARPTPLKQVTPTPVPSSPIQEQSLASPLSSRAHSPETPGRIAHTSTERENAEASGLKQRKSAVRNRSKSSEGTVDSGSGTRGRSPTRRSWKASSERRSLRTRPSALAIQAYLQTLAPETVRPESSTSFDMRSMTRPRTSSRSSSRYSAHIARQQLQEAQAEELRNGMQSRTSTIATGELFFKPIVPTAPTPEVRLNSHSTTPSSQPRSVCGTVVPTPRSAAPTAPRRVSGSTIDPPRMQPVNGSLLRRRKSHRAPRSVVSLPSSQVSDGSERRTPVVDRTPVATPGDPVEASSSRSPQRPPASQRQSFVSVQASTATVAPTVAGPSNRPTQPATSFAFLRLITLLTQFTSDLSTGRQGRPRWKQDCVEFHEEIEQVYEVFREGIFKSRIKFKPWLRDEIGQAEERELEGDSGSERDEGSVIMYLDDVWDRLFGSAASIKQGANTSTVQEDLIRSVVSSWDTHLASCLQGVNASLEQLISMIVDTHFGCAGDGEELRRIVQTIADTELNRASHVTEAKLSELYQLEATTLYSLKARQPAALASSLAHFKDLRQRAQVATLDRAQDNASPVPASFTRPMSRSPLKKSAHVHSHSWDTNTMTVPSTSGGKTGSSQGKQSSTLATSLLPDTHISDEETAAFTRLRRYSLLGGDSAEYQREVKLALTTLANLGFKDITTPEKLFAKLADIETPESVDEVLEVMTNVDAYLEVASARFVDYAAMQIEHHLVNAIGEKINAAVLSTLDLASEGIKQQCVRWMS